MAKLKEIENEIYMNRERTAGGRVGGLRGREERARERKNKDKMSINSDRNRKKEKESSMQL